MNPLNIIHYMACHAGNGSTPVSQWKVFFFFSSFSTKATHFCSYIKLEECLKSTYYCQ